jgi:hypothetical protein
MAYETFTLREAIRVQKDSPVPGTKVENGQTERPQVGSLLIWNQGGYPAFAPSALPAANGAARRTEVSKREGLLVFEDSYSILFLLEALPARHLSSS